MFRDDRDALLARVDALEAEKARLEERIDALTAERDAAIAARDEAIERAARPPEPPPAAPPPRARPRRSAAGLSPKQKTGLVLLPLLLVGMGAVAIARSRCQGGPTPATLPDASPEQRLLPLRLCLDNGDLYVRAFLAGPEGRRHDQVRGHAQSCLNMLDAAAVALGDAPRAYREAFAAIVPDVERLTVYHESRQIDDDGGALGAELTAAMAEQVAAWKQASLALRGWLDGRYQTLRDQAAEHRRVHGPPGAWQAISFAAAAASFLDLLADDRTDAAALDKELGWLREHRRRAGAYARRDMADFIEHAAAIVAIVTARGGAPVQADTAGHVEALGWIYNANSYALPDPF